MENVSWLDPVASKIFVTTRWSVVNACKQGDEVQSKAALTELCQAYWQPVYVCIRHHGHSSHDAEDLTQNFFLRLLKGTWLKHLDESKGRFRVYLGVALRNFLRDDWRRRWTLRRGRGVVVVDIDSEEGDGTYRHIPATTETPESLYERQWANAVVEHALEELNIELKAAEKDVLFGHFDAIMTANTRDFPYRTVANALGISVETLHGTLYRWRQRFHVLLREEIARTVVSKREIDCELQYLMHVFSHGA